MNSIRYNVPIKNCPTKDNVRVGVDVSLTFRIGPGHDECMKFIYDLGPSKLDQMLEAESEEAIRNFVYSVRLSNIQDIKGEIASTLLSDLNRKFVAFGVFFENVHIIEIRIPTTLKRDLKKTTGYDVKLQKQIKQHQNEMLTCENEENRKLTELQRTNAINIQEMRAKNERALIAREEKKVNAMSEYEVKSTMAEQRASVLMTKVKGQKATVESETKKEVLELVNSAKTESASKKIKADHEAAILIMRADAQFEASKSKYEAALIEARAESANIEGLSAIRKHELAMAKAEVLQEIAKNSDIVMGGDTADSLLKQFI
jgi:regulator of protease activity HflC (stomatin/prohibitin superfamily)